MAYKVYPEFLNYSIPGAYPATHAGLQSALDDCYAKGGGHVTVSSGAIIGDMATQSTVNLRPNTAILSSTTSVGALEYGLSNRPTIFGKIVADLPAAVNILSNTIATPTVVTTHSPHNFPVGSVQGCIVTGANAAIPAAEYYAKILSANTFELYQGLPPAQGGSALGAAANGGQNGEIRLNAASYGLYGIQVVSFAQGGNTVHKSFDFSAPNDGPKDVTVNLLNSTLFAQGSWDDEPVVLFNNGDNAAYTRMTVTIRSCELSCDGLVEGNPNNPIIVVKGETDINFHVHDSTLGGTAVYQGPQGIYPVLLGLGDGNSSGDVRGDY